jgi:nucleotide-binding universal stress UspA family protein
MVTIVHASAATPEDRPALEHAVALAERAGARVISIHANGSPSAREAMIEAPAILRAWGREPSGVEHERVVHECCDDPVDALLDALRAAEPDLVVAATHQRTGPLRILLESRAEAIAENVKAPTLLIPLDGRSFVDGHGSIDLRRILVPIGDMEAARVAVERALWLVDLARTEEVEVVLLHVGEPDTTPSIPLPDHPRARWSHHEVPSGRLEDAVAGAAGEACVVVMATRGHDSLRDAIFGSHTERVLRTLDCPLLSVPIDA